MGPPRAPSQPARACNGPRSAAPPLASDPAAASSRVSRSSARANRGLSGWPACSAVSISATWACASAAVSLPSPGGGHRAAQISQRPARVLGGDKRAVLLPGDVLVPGDVVDDAGVLVADVEGHLALPGGMLGGHGIGSG